MLRLATTCPGHDSIGKTCCTRKPFRRLLPPSRPPLALFRSTCPCTGMRRGVEGAEGPARAAVADVGDAAVACAEGLAAEGGRRGRRAGGEQLRASADKVEALGALELV
eukprot:4240149-Prymnesium_polylepis.1